MHRCGNWELMERVDVAQAWSSQRSRTQWTFDDTPSPTCPGARALEGVANFKGACGQSLGIPDVLHLTLLEVSRYQTNDFAHQAPV
jgi:hypothetical protein